MSIKLGDKVKDTITGFTGIAVARLEYLAGCVRISIQPQTLGADGELIEAEYFDEGLVELAEANGIEKAKPTGGLRTDPPSRETNIR